MRNVPLTKLINYCDRILRTAKVEDYPGAYNGLQVQNSGSVTKIGAAVDVTAATVRLAIENHVDLLLGHHGLFWSPGHPWTGKRYELMKLLLEANLAVYSSHLPLDAHPRLGNNVLLCAALGMRRTRPFFFDHGQFLGRKARLKIRRNELAQLLRRATGTQSLLIPGGPEVCQNVGVVTGGAGSELKKAAAEGVDTFITGEGPHWTFALAEDLGINVLYGGHYATETFGVKALAQHLSKQFHVPWIFIDHPSGL